MALSFADFLSVEQFIEDQENENTKKKTQQNVALLKEFLTLKNESRTIEEIQRIYHYGTKEDNNEDYEPSSLSSLMASFERYLKKKKYGFSIMKDAEFDQVQFRLFKHIRIQYFRRLTTLSGSKGDIVFATCLSFVFI